MKRNLKEKLLVVPDQPGCYLMKDRHQTVIYVGKSKSLRNRIRTYFTKANDRKTQRLVQEIEDFEYIVTSTEIDALVLEMNLIKKYDPKYNVLLKDDKSYPYLKITSERHPRLLITRKVKNDRGKYFGPYPNVLAARETKKLLDRMFPLRKCNNPKGRECLYYHMGQCFACSDHPPTEKEYEEMIKNITSFLRGGHREIKRSLEEKMYEASEQLNFERAKELRDQIQHIEAIMERQQMVLNDRADRDIFGYHCNKGWMCVQVFFVRQGKLIERDVSIFPFFGDEKEAFITYIGRFYLHQNHPKPDYILVPIGTDVDLLNRLLEVKVYTPFRGSKKHLVRLATKNAQVALKEKFSLIELDERRTIQAVERLGEILHIETPHRIEAFDNSNIHGVDPVSAMVVFIDGRSKRNEYRKYKLTNIEGPDDYEMMRQVIRRRYTRVLKDKLPLPDMIIVDGGKGQMSAARDVLENELGLDIPLCGVVKDERHQTSQLLFGDPPLPVSLANNSYEFYLVQRIQDEVHRFAISYHRQTRRKSLIQSELDQIPGVGEKRRNTLLQHFKTIENIKKASKDELLKLGIPRNVASAIIDYFQQKQAKEKQV